MASTEKRRPPIDFNRDLLSRYPILNRLHIGTVTINILLNDVVQTFLGKFDFAEWLETRRKQQNGVLMTADGRATTILDQVIDILCVEMLPLPSNMVVRAKHAFRWKGSLDCVSEYMNKRFGSLLIDEQDRCDLFDTSRYLSEFIRMLMGFIAQVGVMQRVNNLSQFMTETEEHHYLKIMFYDKMLNLAPRTLLFGPKPCLDKYTKFESRCGSQAPRVTCRDLNHYHPDNQHMSFSRIPDDVHYVIFSSFDDVCHLMRMRLVCQRWNNIIVDPETSNGIWMHLTYHSAIALPLFKYFTSKNMSLVEFERRFHLNNMSWYEFYLNSIYCIQKNLVELSFALSTTITNDIYPGVQSCIYFMNARSVHHDEDVALGRTRIGGQPDLPQYIRWRREWGEFIVQINFSELRGTISHGGLIPDSGILYLFTPDTMNIDEATPVSAYYYTGSTSDLCRGGESCCSTSIDKDNSSGWDRGKVCDKICDGLSCPYFNPDENHLGNAVPWSAEMDSRITGITTPDIPTGRIDYAMFCQVLRVISPTTFGLSCIEPIVIWQTLDLNAQMHLFYIDKSDLLKLDFSRVYYQVLT